MTDCEPGKRTSRKMKGKRRYFFKRTHEKTTIHVKDTLSLPKYGICKPGKRTISLTIVFHLIQFCSATRGCKRAAWPLYWTDQYGSCQIDRYHCHQIDSGGRMLHQLIVIAVVVFGYLFFLQIRNICFTRDRLTYIHSGGKQPLCGKQKTNNRIRRSYKNIMAVFRTTKQFDDDMRV